MLLLGGIFLFFPSSLYLYLLSFFPFPCEMFKGAKKAMTPQLSVKEGDWGISPLWQTPVVEGATTEWPGHPGSGLSQTLTNRCQEQVT